MTHPMRLYLGLGMAVLLSGPAFAGPPTIGSVDVHVTNPVLSVEVSNADPIPVSLGDQGTPFAVSFDCWKNSNGTQPCPVHELRAAQRAVIEQMSGTCYGKGTNVAGARIRTSTGGEYHEHQLPVGLGQQGTEDETMKYYSFGGLMRVYANAGAQIQSQYSVDDISAEAYGCSWSISGLLFTVLGPVP